MAEKVTPQLQAALPQRRPAGLHAALGFFTAIPVPAFGVVDRVVAARAIRAFPVVGALLGLGAGLVALGSGLLGAGPLLVAGLYLGLMAAATGAIHLDGIADTADGLGSRKPPAEALEIMRKSDVGPMGVACLVLALLVEWSALAQLAPDRGAFLVAAVAGPAVGRLTLLAATGPRVPMARSAGFGALFGRVTPAAVTVAGDALALVLLAGAGYAVAGVRGALVGAAAIAVALLVAALWRRHLVRRLGGMTGDTFGSAVELAQACCWLVLALGR